MTAELATPDSLDSLDKSGEETEEEEGLQAGQVREEEEREEEKSLLNEDDQQKPSPTIQVAGGVLGGEVGDGGGGGGVSPGSTLIKVDREAEKPERPQVRGRCGSVCGPSPLRVSVLCIVIISFWILIICIVHLDKKMTGVQITLDNTEKLLGSMEDSANEFRFESFLIHIFSFSSPGMKASRN